MDLCSLGPELRGWLWGHFSAGSVDEICGVLFVPSKNLCSKHPGFIHQAVYRNRMRVNEKTVFMYNSMFRVKVIIEQ